MATTGLSDDKAKETVNQLVDQIKIAQFVTCGENGQLHARPMRAQQVTEDGEFWFITDITSRKVAELKGNAKALLTYASPEQQDYVSISGSAEIVTSPEKIKELWTKDAELWFPDGPTDPKVTLVRFKAEAAEYWNSTSNVLVFAFEYLRARLTHQPPTELGDMGQTRYSTY